MDNEYTLIDAAKKAMSKPEHQMVIRLNEVAIKYLRKYQKAGAFAGQDERDQIAREWRHEVREVTRG